MSDANLERDATIERSRVRLAELARAYDREMVETCTYRPAESSDSCFSLRSVVEEYRGDRHRDYGAFIALFLVPVYLLWASLMTIIAVH